MLFLLEQSKFQFHKGTIKTTELLNLQLKFFDFNSIKVQLKRYHGNQ